MTREGVVYELFFTNLPLPGFSACDVVELYLHRGAYAPQLSDEDAEQDPDRWCSHSACGQECWQVVSQWVWNLRLELGHQLHPDPIRTAEFAPAPPLLHRRRLPLRATLLLWWACPGKRVASQGKILLSSLMARCVARLSRSCCRMSAAEKPMAACAWCMRPAFAVVVPVGCASNVNGMGVRRQSRGREVGFYIRSRWDLPRSSGTIGAAEFTGALVSSSCDTNVWR